MVARARVALPDENDPDVGFFRRRAMRLKRLGIVAIGPTVLNPKPPTPTRADEVAKLNADEAVRMEHQAVVGNEISTVDKHLADLVRRIEAIESTSASSFALQEMKSERRLCRELRALLVDELSTGPIMHARDGRELTGRDRALVRLRAAELRESYWAAATRFSAQGEHREARLKRIAALRISHDC